MGVCQARWRRRRLRVLLQQAVHVPQQAASFAHPPSLHKSAFTCEKMLTLAESPSNA